MEIILVFALGLVLWLNSWNGLGPVDTPNAAPPPRVASADQAAAAFGPNNPFRAVSAPLAAIGDDVGGEVAATSLSLTLHGTWVDASGGAAIIQTSDQNQDRFVPGDTIVPGVTLDKVMRDQVIIVSNGVREALGMINRDAAAPEGASAAAEGVSLLAASNGMATIGEFIVARPQPDSIGNLALVLLPSGDMDAFEGLGLQAGDRLVAVDNQPLGTDIAVGLETLAMTAGAAAVTLSIEREGVVMPVTISLSGDGSIE